MREREEREGEREREREREREKEKREKNRERERSLPIKLCQNISFKRKKNICISIRIPRKSGNYLFLSAI